MYQPISIVRKTLAIGLMLVLGSGTILFAQSSKSVVPFELLNRSAKTAKIIRDDFVYGTASLQLILDPSSGEVSEVRLVEEAERRGPRDFADRLSEKASEWRFTPGCSGDIILTVSIPNPGAENRMRSRQAVISVDLRNLRVVQGVEIRTSKSDVRKLVAQEGFQKVFLAAVPVTSVPAGSSWLDTVKEIFNHLGGFKIVFAVLLALFAFVFLLGIRTITRAWEPLRSDGSGGMIMFFKSLLRLPGLGANGRSTFVSSNEARNIRDNWIKAMRHSHLDYQTFVRLRSEDLDKVAKKVSEGSDKDEIISVIEENAFLQEMLGVNNYFEMNGGNDQALDYESKQVKKQLAELYTEDKVKDYYQRVDSCRSSAELHSLIAENGWNISVPDSGMKLSHSRSFSLEDVRSEILDIVETVQTVKRESNGATNSEEVYRGLLWKHASKPKIDEALSICSKYRHDYPLFEIFDSGLQNHLINGNHWWSSQEIDRSVDRTAAVKLEEKRWPLDWLWAIGSLSPMLGLFGTVWGISQAFGKIQSVKDTRELMQNLAGDINIALATTIVGLVIGVLSFVVYYYSKHLLDQEASEIEKYFTDITNNA